MMYRCVGCGQDLSVTASISKPRAVCICTPCMKSTTDADEIARLLNPADNQQKGTTDA